MSSLEQQLFDVYEQCRILKEENIILQNFQEAAGYRDIADTLKRLILKAKEVSKIEVPPPPPSLDLEACCSNLPPFENDEVFLGRAVVIKRFVSEAGVIAGCFVKTAIISKHTKVRVIRNKMIHYRGIIDFIKQFENSVESVKEGEKCGIRIFEFEDIEVGDVIDAYAVLSEVM